MSSETKSKPTWDEYFLGIAEAVAARGSCRRKKVGCVLVRDKRILSIGFNGAISGEPDCFDVGCYVQDGHCVRTCHSEQNAISSAALIGASIEGAVAYVTVRPCFLCAKALANAGVRRAYYKEDYGAQYPISVPLELIKL